MSIYYDLLNESIKEKEIEIIDLDEGTLGKTAATAGMLAALAGGLSSVKTDDHNINVNTTDNAPADYLKVPDYKDMPDLWSDTNTAKPQKVSTKDVPEPTTRTVNSEDKKSEKPSPNLVTKAILNSAESFNDAFNKEWDLNTAYDFVLQFEKFSPKAYKDGTITYNNGKTGTRYSIGYGTKSPNNNPKARISEPEARKAKCEHIKQNVLPLLKKKKVVIQNQNQFDAIVSFAYNTGKVFQKKDGTADIERMQKYIYFDGKPNAGLERRRNAEAIHFLTGA